MSSLTVFPLDNLGRDLSIDASDGDARGGDSRTGEARQRLLVRLLEEFGDDLPAPELSLRELASRTGTSHPLLRYHFGSHAGVLAAMLGALRERENDTLRRAAETATFTEFVEIIWSHYALPDGLRRVNSFFYIVGLAVHDHDTFADFITSLDELLDLLTAVAVRDGRSPEDARLSARVAVAALRGLLLEQTLSGREAGEALELLRSMLSR